MSNADRQTARKLEITVAAFAEYREAGAPLEQPAAFVRWLRKKWSQDHAPQKLAA